jgi:spoIIIJ-associated protein
MKEKIEEIVKNFLDNLSVEVIKISAETLPNDSWGVFVETNDERSLIGKDNANFEAFGHIIRRILAKALGEDVKISIDVNNIKSAKDEVLRKKASVVAERARQYKMDIEMEPMSSYERMVIHTFFENVSDIKTESIGEGKDRRLIIKFTPIIEESKSI